MYVDTNGFGGIIASCIASISFFGLYRVEVDIGFGFRLIKRRFISLICKSRLCLIVNGLPPGPLVSFFFTPSFFLLLLEESVLFSSASSSSIFFTTLFLLFCFLLCILLNVFKSPRLHNRKRKR